MERSSLSILAAVLGAFFLTQPLVAQSAHESIIEKNIDNSAASLQAFALTEEADKRVNDSDPFSALPLHEKALRLRHEVGGERHFLTLDSQATYANTLMQVGRDSEAEPLHAEVLRLRREVMGELSLDTIDSMLDYSNVLVNLGRATEAETWSAKVLQIRRDNRAVDDTGVFESRNWHAVVLEEIGRVDDAELLHLKSMRFLRAQSGPVHRTTLAIQRSYANFLIGRGRAHEAEPLLAEVLRNQRALDGVRHPRTINSLGLYSDVLESLSRAIEAEPLSAEALRLSREVLGEWHPTTISRLNNYAGVLETLGRRDEALPLYAKAVRASRQGRGERHPATLISLNNYGYTLERLGRLAEAETVLAESLRLRSEVLGERHPDTLNAIFNYAHILARRGRELDAEPLFAEALNLRRAVLGERHPDTLTSMNGYADLLANLGRSDEAVSLFDEALRVRRDVLGGRHRDTLTSIKDYAETLLEVGSIERALPMSRELAAAIRSRANDLEDAGMRGSIQSVRELGNRQSVEKLLADALWANFDPNRNDQEDLQVEAFTAMQLSSAGSTSRAVAEAAAARFASAQGLLEIVQERQGLVRSWAEIEAILVEAQADGTESSAERESLRSRLSQFVRRIGEIDRRLETEAPQYFTILNRQSVELEQVRRILGADEAVLFFVPTQFGTHIMVVTDTELHWARAAIDEEEMGAMVGQFRNGLEVRAGQQNLPVFDFDRAYELYGQLIAPAEVALQGKSRVYVVAGGALSRLPLGTLLVSEPAPDADLDDAAELRELEWLADRYALIQLPSLQSLVYIRSFSNSDGRQSGEQCAGCARLDLADGFRGFGAPVLEGEARLRGARSATLPAIEAARLVSNVRGLGAAPLMDPSALKQLAQLPGTRYELEQIRAALGASENALFLAEQMTEPAIRNADLSAVRILHLATHGFTSEQSGSMAEPGLVFTPPDEAQPQNDGYLAASEVVGLDLSSADWVILSACNTAAPSGGSDQTGLSGLARAFFYAGAESLLVSHWPVFDDIAPILTVEVMKRSQNGQPRAEALQAVMREIRDNPELNAAHPAVWAPFALVGEGR